MSLPTLPVLENQTPMFHASKILVADLHAFSAGCEFKKVSNPKLLNILAARNMGLPMKASKATHDTPMGLRGRAQNIEKLEM
jgi:hypothetical protein